MLNVAKWQSGVVANRDGREWDIVLLGEKGRNAERERPKRWERKVETLKVVRCVKICGVLQNLTLLGCI